MSNLPEQIVLLKEYLLEPARFRRIARQGMLITVLLLVTLFCAIFLRRRLRRVIARQEHLFLPSTKQKILRAGTRILYRMLFHSLLLLAAFLIFSLATIGKKVLLAIVILFAGLTTYRLAKSLIQELFMPWEPQQRLIHCRDNVAAYLYRHLLRIIFYGTFLPTFILILEAVEYREGLIALLWLVFRLGFLMLLILLTYNKEAMVSLLPRAENWLEKVIYVTATKIYPLFVLFIICIVALQSLGYITLARFLVRSLLMTGVILGAARLVSKGLDKLLRWWFLSAGRREREFLLSQEAAETIYDISSYVIAYLVYILAIFTILGIWGVDLSGLYATLTAETSRDYFWRLLSAGLVILISTVALRTIYYSIDKVFILSPEEVRAWRKKLALGDKGKTIAPLLKDLMRYVTIFVASLLVLLKLGVDPTPILAGLGVISLALGFGAQTLVRDVISGLFILFEGLIAVGDVINFGDTAGVVEEVGLRVTKYREFSGELRVIPNGEIRTFGNFNRQWVRAIVPVGVAYEQDVGKAMRVMEEVGKAWAAERAHIVLEPPEVQGIMSFDDSAITIRLVVKLKPLQHWVAERELKLRLKEAFDREGVEIPFPRRVVYTRQEKNGMEEEHQKLILLAQQASEEEHSRR
jgi:small conductance mechanosensitive channel